MEHRTAAASDRQSDVGLLIVHGIGEQKRGETAEKLVGGLSLAYGDRLTVTRDEAGVPLELSLDERTVRLYEVHWADILCIERVRSTFSWKVIRALGWFPWLNWKAGLLRPRMYSRREALIWSVLLVPVTLALYTAYMGARLFAQVFRERKPPDVDVEGLSGWAKWRAIADAYAEQGAHGRTAVEDVLDAFAGDVTNYVASLGRTGGDPDGIDRAGEEILDRFYVKLAEALDDGCREIQILSHSLGTVVAYHGLSGQFVEAAPRGRRLARRYDPIPSLTHLYTIGSPLEKIRFFWPTTIDESILGPFSMVDEQAVRADYDELRAGTEPADGDEPRSRTAPADDDEPMSRALRSDCDEPTSRALRGDGDEPTSRVFRWENFHHRFDMVSARLRRFEHWGAVQNHALKGGGGLMRSHVIYERSPEFLSSITEGLFGEPASPAASRSSRLRDQVLSTLENLAVPVGIALLLATGLLLYALTALIPGFLLSLPFRIVGNYDWALLIQNVVTFPVAISMGLIALWYPFMVRREAKALHTLWTDGERHPYLPSAPATQE